MHIKQFLFEIKSQNILGENVLWHENEQALYWTDIEGKRLYKCAMSAQLSELLRDNTSLQKVTSDIDEYIERALQIFDLPMRLGSFAFTSQKNTLVAGFENGFAIYDYASGEIKWLSQKEVNAEHLRYNDGKCDPSGRFWLGSMVENKDVKKLKLEEQAALYCFSFDQGKLQVNQKLSGIRISNGVCFSQQGRLMYHTDSASHKVYQYSVGENGTIESRKQFAKFDKHIFPDGACTDTQGNVWIALWGAACVACFNEKGRELFRHPLPVTQGTCVAIGGPDMNWLFVTSASYSLSEENQAKQPRAGNVLVYEISSPVGVSEPHVPID